jgi:Cu-processing system permease protein
MNITLKIFKYELQDVLRGKWVIFYALLFLGITDALFRFGGDSSRVLVSLMNVVLIVIPLVSIIFGSLYIYNSREFIELFLCQPLDRKHLYFGMYAGVAIPLISGFTAGILLPMIYFGQSSAENWRAIIILLCSGTGLTLIFLALSFYISVSNQDRIKGLSISILLWLFFTVLYDGLILILIYVFADYPLEKAVLVFSFLNPVDLARVLLLMEFDISALMGYTGAVFQNFFGGSQGIVVSIISIIIWISIPLTLGLRRFIKKDL